MNYSPENYSSFNTSQMIEGVKLIRNILKDNKNEKFDVILDIGCGTGNLTLQLAQSLKHNHIVGVDIDSEMIRYAKENNSKENIDYNIVDIGAPWDQLPEKIKDLKGKVSLIFSNMVLHWVRKRDNVAENIFNLLKPGGKFYFNIYIHDDDIYPFDLSDEKRAEIQKLIKFPTQSEHIELWKNAVTKANLKINDLKSYFVYRPITEEGFNKYAIPLTLEVFKNYIDEDDKDKIIEKYKDVLVKGLKENFCYDLTKLNPHSKDKYAMFGGRFQLVGQK